MRRHRRTRSIILAFATLLALTAMPAAAITWGQPDGTRHPATGALVEPYGGVLGASCSGALIAPTVFLTAAHCAADGASVRVSFDTRIDNRAKTYDGVFHAHPGYDQAQSDSADIAVVVLAKPVKGITPVALPTAGLLDALATKGRLASQTFTAVGYGAQETTPAPGGHTLSYLDIREYAVGTFNALNPGYLRISQNPATGNGGTCYGDSGGPNFLGSGTSETTTLVAVTVTGDAFCKATNVTYRTDTASARGFLANYLTLP